MKCMIKGCTKCSTSSCRGNVLLINTFGVPTWDRIKHALDGKESGLSRSQISQVFSYSYFKLGRILGQMLDANLIQVLDADDETRYRLQQGPLDNSTTASTSNIIHYGTLHQSHDADLINCIPQRPSDQIAERETTQDSNTQTLTALDALAKVCDHLLVPKEHSPACRLLQGEPYISKISQERIGLTHAKYHSTLFEK